MLAGLGSHADLRKLGVALELGTSTQHGTCEKWPLLCATSLVSNYLPSQIQTP